MTEIRREVEAAEQRIRGFVVESPLSFSSFLSQQLAASVYLKLESLQVTRSFKVRGAFSKLLSLDAEQRRCGVVTASTGNHGIAVGYAANKLGIRGSIFLPDNVSRQKLEKLNGYPLDVVLVDGDCVAAETSARRQGRSRGRVYVSPYNDAQVIGGQGTIAPELCGQLDPIDVVMVPVGGGGLISGIAGYLKESGASVRVIGCLPETSPEMARSIQTGQRMEPLGLDTLSDGTVGGFETGSITVEPCKRYVDDWVLVSEDEIRQAMRAVFESHGLAIEGSAAVAVASSLKLGSRLAGKTVAVIVSGGNVDPERFKEIVWPTNTGR